MKFISIDIQCYLYIIAIFSAVRMGRVPNAEKDKMLQEIAEAKLCSPDTEDDLTHKEFVDRITGYYTECYEQSSDEEVQGFRKYCSSVSVILLITFL